MTKTSVLNLLLDSVSVNLPAEEEFVYFHSVDEWMKIISRLRLLCKSLFLNEPVKFPQVLVPDEIFLSEISEQVPVIAHFDIYGYPLEDCKWISSSSAENLLKLKNVTITLVGVCSKKKNKKKYIKGVNDSLDRSSILRSESVYLSDNLYHDDSVADILLPHKNSQLNTFEILNQQIKYSKIPQENIKNSISNNSDVIKLQDSISQSKKKQLNKKEIISSDQKTVSTPRFASEVYESKKSKSSNELYIVKEPEDYSTKDIGKKVKHNTILDKKIVWNVVNELLDICTDSNTYYSKNNQNMISSNLVLDESSSINNMIFNDVDIPYGLAQGLPSNIVLHCLGINSCIIGESPREGEWIIPLQKKVDIIHYNSISNELCLIHYKLGSAMLELFQISTNSNSVIITSEPKLKTNIKKYANITCQSSRILANLLAVSTLHLDELPKYIGDAIDSDHRILSYLKLLSSMYLEYQIDTSCNEYDDSILVDNFLDEHETSISKVTINTVNIDKSNENDNSSWINSFASNSYVEKPKRLWKHKSSGSSQTQKVTKSLIKNGMIDIFKSSSTKKADEVLNPMKSIKSPKENIWKKSDKTLSPIVEEEEAQAFYDFKTLRKPLFPENDYIAPYQLKNFNIKPKNFNQSIDFYDINHSQTLKLNRKIKSNELGYTESFVVGNESLSLLQQISFLRSKGLSEPYHILYDCNTQLSCGLVLLNDLLTQLRTNGNHRFEFCNGNLKLITPMELLQMYESKSISRTFSSTKQNPEKWTNLFNQDVFLSMYLAPIWNTFSQLLPKYISDHHLTSLYPGDTLWIPKGTWSANGSNSKLLVIPNDNSV